MKKCISLFLCLLLLPGLILPVHAEVPDYDVYALIRRQIHANSTYHFECTATLGGAAPFGMDPGLWGLLKQKSASLKLSGSYVLSRAKATLGQSQLRLTLTDKDTDLLTAVATGIGDRTILSGLTEGSALSLPRGENGVWDMLYALQGESWPSLIHALMNVTADSLPENLLSPYYAEVSEWLAGYTQISVLRAENGTYSMRADSVIAPDALSSMAVRLLSKLYADEALMTALGASLTEAEKDAFLTPGMLPVLMSALYNSGLTAPLTLRRDYDSSGYMDSWELFLPFAGNISVLITTRNLTALPHTEVLLTTPERVTAICFDNEQTDSLALSGSFSSDSTDGGHSGGTFALSGSFGGLVVSEEETRYARRQDAMLVLVLQPDEQSDFHAQLLTVNLCAHAWPLGEFDDRPSYLEGSLLWQDLTGGTDITLYYSSRTGAPINLQKADSSARVLDGMNAEELQSVMSEILARLIGCLN